ncbi:DUF1758 domain-containing protein [Trichonephila clavipes]|nr:DUF1758 domain-containing protein [Trichonephila clavipes]
MEVRSRSSKKCVSEVGVENIGEEESISTELRRFWEIESLGILDKGSVTLGNGDEEILSEFDKSVNFIDGRYRVNLPWKPGMREALQNNKTVARKRFEGLVRRFKCDHELFCEYKGVIDDYVREGIVERTSCDSLLDSQGFYLPHHAVIRSDKTASPIRIVFDGSAHENGQSSLNQSLYTGPNLHPNILELLLCFRKSPVAFTADVKSAFLQIELDFRDRGFTRFFWTDNLNNEPYVLNFTRVLFGLRPSPYLLAATLKHHFKKYREQYPHTFELLNSSIYVDDLICGQNDVPDALRTTLECLQIILVIFIIKVIFLLLTTSDLALVDIAVFIWIILVLGMRVMFSNTALLFSKNFIIESNVGTSAVFNESSNCFLDSLSIF